jgi:endoglucanase
VRDVLAPIERTVAAEFPGFDPPPFGAKQWIAVLVRHILLAEPLAEEFGRCFAGVDIEQARALADSFRFDRSLVRRPLAEAIQIR